MFERENPYPILRSFQPLNYWTTTDSNEFPEVEKNPGGFSIKLIAQRGQPCPERLTPFVKIIYYSLVASVAGLS